VFSFRLSKMSSIEQHVQRIEALQSEHRQTHRRILQLEKEDPELLNQEIWVLYNKLHALVHELIQLQIELTESQRLEMLERETQKSLAANKSFETELQLLADETRETGFCFVCEDQGISSCSICRR
jgi:hypothetical protein